MVCITHLLTSGRYAATICAERSCLYSGVSPRPMGTTHQGTHDGCETHPCLCVPPTSRSAATRRLIEHTHTHTHTHTYGESTHVSSYGTVYVAQDTRDKEDIMMRRTRPHQQQHQEHQRSQASSSESPPFWRSSSSLFSASFAGKTDRQTKREPRVIGHQRHTRQASRAQKKLGGGRRRRERNVPKERTVCAHIVCRNCRAAPHPPQSLCGCECACVGVCAWYTVCGTVCVACAPRKAARRDSLSGSVEGARQEYAPGGRNIGGRRTAETRSF